MILVVTAQTLTEAVKKSNRLEKCLMINGGGHFHLRRRSQLTISQNAFMETVKK
jgi:hypothetical protein